MKRPVLEDGDTDYFDTEWMTKELSELLDGGVYEEGLGNLSLHEDSDIL